MIYIWDIDREDIRQTFLNQAASKTATVNAFAEPARRLKQGRYSLQDLKNFIYFRNQGWDTQMIPWSARKKYQLYKDVPVMGNNSHLWWALMSLEEN